jgi:hypothetical protein
MRLNQAPIEPSSVHLELDKETEISMTDSLAVPAMVESHPSRPDSVSPGACLRPISSLICLDDRTGGVMRYDCKLG